MKTSHRIGLIVPVLDDARPLERLLAWRARACPEVEAWVVDGGSVDGSVDMAMAHGVRVLTAGANRAGQLNHGARAAIEAGCDVLWFVHADALPADESIAAIARTLEGGAVGGAFRRRFEHPSRFLRLTCWLADWRGRCFGWFLGDQAVWARADAFEGVGGFPVWAWFEDLELARRLRAFGPTRLLEPIVHTSARRFEALGPVRRTWRDLRLTLHYWRTGKPPAHPREHGATAPRSVEAPASR